MSNDARAKAWKTRREKYGERGHSGTYSCGGGCEHCQRMARAIVRLHNEGVLTEGQAAKITGMDRVSLRRIADRLKETAPAALGRAPENRSEEEG